MTGYYVGIKEPSKARRDLLQSAKCSVTILKSKHKLKEIRAQKVERMTRLVALTDELKDILGSIDKALPEHQPGKEPKIVRKAKEDALAKLKKPSTPKTASGSSKKRAKPAKSSKKPAKKAVVKKQSAKSLSDAEEEELLKLERKLSEIESKLNKL